MTIFEELSHFISAFLSTLKHRNLSRAFTILVSQFFRPFIPAYAAL